MLTTFRTASSRSTCHASFTLNVAKRNTSIMVTGSMGQIGTELIHRLRKKYGAEKVIATDIKMPSSELAESGPFRYLDVRDERRFRKLIIEHRVDWLVHNSTLLSATGEQNPNLAVDVNIHGFHNAVRICADYGVRLYSPSSIAAFGPSTPRDYTPDVTLMSPTTIYGISKVHMELMGSYYHEKFGLDFRSLRYPGVLSYETLPAGGTTDYAVDIFLHALLHGKYHCFLQPHTRLPMMFMDDCLKATQEVLECGRSQLRQNVYNVSAMSFTPEEIADEIKKHMPQFEITYPDQPDFRQPIADTWPRSLDDSRAREDWGWCPDYDIHKLCAEMLTGMRNKLLAQNPERELVHFEL